MTATWVGSPYTWVDYPGVGANETTDTIMNGDIRDRMEYLKGIFDGTVDRDFTNLATVSVGFGAVSETYPAALFKCYVNVYDKDNVAKGAVPSLDIMVDYSSPGPGYTSKITFDAPTTVGVALYESFAASADYFNFVSNSGTKDMQFTCSNFAFKTSSGQHDFGEYHGAIWIDRIATNPTTSPSSGGYLYEQATDGAYSSLYWKSSGGKLSRIGLV